MITVTCPGCGASRDVAPTLAGRRIKCPSCKEAFDVPAADASGGSTGRGPGIAIAGGALLVAVIVVVALLARDGPTPKPEPGIEGSPPAPGPTPDPTPGTVAPPPVAPPAAAPGEKLAITRDLEHRTAPLLLGSDAWPAVQEIAWSGENLELRHEHAPQQTSTWTGSGLYVGPGTLPAPAPLRVRFGEQEVTVVPLEKERWVPLAPAETQRLGLDATLDESRARVELRAASGEVVAHVDAVLASGELAILQRVVRPKDQGGVQVHEVLRGGRSVRTGAGSAVPFGSGRYLHHFASALSLLDVETGKQTWAAPGRVELFHAWEDKEWVLASGEGKVRLLQVGKDAPLGECAGRGSWWVVRSPDSAFLLCRETTAGGESAIVLRTLPSLEERARFRPRQAYDSFFWGAWGGAFSRDSQRVLVWGQSASNAPEVFGHDLARNAAIPLTVDAFAPRRHARHAADADGTLWELGRGLRGWRVLRSPDRVVAAEVPAIGRAFSGTSLLAVAPGLAAHLVAQSVQVGPAPGALAGEGTPLPLPPLPNHCAASSEAFVVLDTLTRGLLVWTPGLGATHRTIDLKPLLPGKQLDLKWMATGGGTAALRVQDGSGGGKVKQHFLLVDLAKGEARNVDELATWTCLALASGGDLVAARSPRWIELEGGRYREDKEPPSLVLRRLTDGAVARRIDAPAGGLPEELSGSFEPGGQRFAWCSGGAVHVADAAGTEVVSERLTIAPEAEIVFVPGRVFAISPGGVESFAVSSR